MNRQNIESKEQLIELLNRMSRTSRGDSFENETTDAFIEALAAWLQDCDGYYKNIGESRDTNEADWQLIADAIQAATIYE